jgi:CRP/FNR family transcriptional regulator, cyclic AMP receptor protein
MTIHTLEPIIQATPFFQGMEERHIELITGCARNVRFVEGETIFREGDAADQFYLIRSGLVSVQFMIPHRGLTTILTVREGDVLGWSWLFPPYRWHFDARTQQPTHALAFDGKCLRTKCEEDHDLGYEIFKRFTQIVNERLESTRLQLLDLYANHG